VDNNLGPSLYAERIKRVQDAIALRETDRVPTLMFSMFWHAHASGSTCREMMYDYDKLGRVFKPLLLDLEPDMYMLPHLMNSHGPALELIGFRQLKWPGHGAPDNAVYQYLDHEYMKADEYDDYLFDPTGYFLSTYMPRVAERFKGLSQLPAFPGKYYFKLIAALPQFADIEDDVLAMIETGKEVKRMMAKADGFAMEMAQLGFPAMPGGYTSAPFDYFGDWLRGSKAIMLDMHRRKDKLLAAMEKAVPFLVNEPVTTAAKSPSKIVFMPLHWCFDTFMSDAQFKTFFWPTLRKVLIQLIDHGLTPMVLWEHDCSSRLDVIGDIPPGKTIYWFERTDLVKAKEVLGDVVCVQGNVPASVLSKGTPDEVDAHCRHLIEKVGKGGGFILTGAVGIPDEAPIENVRAMYHSVRKYSA